MFPSVFYIVILTWDLGDKGRLEFNSDMFACQVDKAWTCGNLGCHLEILGKRTPQWRKQPLSETDCGAPL